MSEYRAVFSDIRRASKVFREGATRFADISPKDGPKPPKVTEVSLQKALSQVLSAIGVMHDSIAASMTAHANKLQRAHDTYIHADKKSKETIERLAQTLSDPDAIR